MRLRLQNLNRRLEQVQETVRMAPQVAANTMGDLVRQSEQKQQAPDGTAWPEVKRGTTFDPKHHIQYKPAVQGESALLVSSHPAARFTRFGTRYMPSRAKVPTGDDLGWWLPIITNAIWRPLG